LKAEQGPRDSENLTLRVGEDLFRGLFENSRDAIMMLEPPSWKFSAVNPAAVAMFGTNSPGELVSMPPWQVSPVLQPDGRPSAEKALEMIDAAMRAGFHSFDWSHRRLGGEVFAATVLLTRVEIAGRRFLQATVSDTTQASRAAEALRISEERFRLIVANTHDIIFTLTGDGIFTFVSNAWTKLLGHPVDQVVGQRFHVFVHPDDLAVCEAFLRKVIETEQVQEGVEYRVQHLDGTWFWHASSAVPTRDEGGTVVGFQGIARDITGRKHAEAYEEMGREIQRILADLGSLPNSMQRVITVLKTGIGLDAVGIRLDDGEDFSYVAQQGFPDDFLLTENKLAERAIDGSFCRGIDGKVRLECTCGMVISGLGDPDWPSCTPGGSFWTGDSIQLLGLASGDDPRFHPRNRCIHEGYASIALVPIRTPDGIIGLIQFNDRRKGRFSGDSIEDLEAIAGHVGEALARWRMEVALHESEANFRTFFESMTDMVVVCTTEGRILHTNAAFTQALGYTPGEFKGMHLLDLHPADRRREAEEIIAAMLRGECENCQLPLACKDGSLLPVETNAWLGRWSGEECVFGISRNLSAQQEANERFERLFRRNPALMALSSLPDMIFLDVNDAWLETLGFSAAEVIGKTAAQIGVVGQPSDQQEAVRPMDRDGRFRDLEMKVRRKDGQILDGLFSGSRPSRWCKSRSPCRLQG
jgi:PAS domain S-box-containing protein